MSTTVFPVDALPDIHRGIRSNDLTGSATGWAVRQLDTARGAVVTGAARATVTGPTNGLECVDSTLTSNEFISPPIDQDVTISGTITFNVWMAESNMNANVSAGVVIDRLDSTGAVVSTIVSSPRNVEVPVSTPTAQNWTASPSSTAMLKGDRLRIRLYGDDASGGTNMAASFTFTGSWSGPTGGSNGDTFITFTETFGFQTTDPTGSQVFLTDVASDVGTAGTVDREAWTSRGDGVDTDVTNTSAGPVAAPGIQVTDTAGGTPVEWFTKRVQAFTLGGLVKANVRGLVSSAAANAGLRVEIARVDADGSNATVWASGCLLTGSANLVGDLGTAETVLSGWLAGDDLAVSDGQRIRIRLYLEDPSVNNMASGQTVTTHYDGTSGSATGDTWVTFTQTLVEFVATTPSFPALVEDSAVEQHELGFDAGIAPRGLEAFTEDFVVYEVAAQTPVAQTFSMPWEATQGITQTWSDPFDAQQGVAAVASLPYTATSAITKTVTVPWEATGAISQTWSGPWDATQGVAAVSSAPWTATGYVAGTTSSPWEAGGQISAVASMPWEAIVSGITQTWGAPWEAVVGGITQTWSDPWDATQGIASTGSAPWEAGGFATTTWTAPWEATQGVAATTSPPWDATGSVTGTASAPWESTGYVAGTGSAPWEAGGFATQAFSMPWEAIVSGIVMTASLPWEAQQGISAVWSDPYDATGAVSSSKTAPWEATGAVAGTGSAPWDATGPVTGTASAPWEATGPVSSTSSAPWEALQTINGTGSFPWEADQSAGGVTQSFSMPWESTATVAVTTSNPWEAFTVVSSTASAPWEGQQGVAGTRSAPWDATGSVVSTVTGPWEARGIATGTSSSFWESVQVVSATTSNPWEAQQALAKIWSGPYDAAQGIATAASLPWDARGQVTVTASLPWEATQTAVIPPDEFVEGAGRALGLEGTGSLASLEGGGTARGIG